MKRYSFIFFLASFLGVTLFTACEEEATLDGATEVYITIDPMDIALKLGDTVRISAKVTNVSGKVIETPVSWSIEDKSVAALLGDTAVVALNGGQEKETRLKAMLENGKYALTTITVSRNLPDGVMCIPNDSTFTEMLTKRSYNTAHDSVLFSVSPKELLYDYEPVPTLEGLTAFDPVMTVDTARGLVAVHYAAPRSSGKGKVTLSVGDASTAKTASCDITLAPQLLATFYGKGFENMPYLDTRPSKEVLSMYFAYTYETEMDINSEDTLRIAMNVQSGAREDIEAGKGAYYGSNNDKVAAFYKQATGKELPAFTSEMGKLDWLVVNRSSLDEPVVIPSAYFKDKDGKSSLKATWYSEADMNIVAAVKSATEINRTFVDGAQPDESVPANQPFSVVWEGEIYPPESGQYLLGVETDRGVRMYVDGRQLIDEYYNESPMKQDRPVVMEAGKPVKVRLVYRQTRQSGQIQLKWSQPSAATIAPQKLFERVKNEGTTLILLGSTETWMKSVAEYTNTVYNGYYNVGKDWIGGIHFVKKHPLFEGLPVDDALNWPYQVVVKNGDRRFGFRMQGEELVVGSYRSTPFELGTAVGVIPCGKGKIIFSSLDIADNLSDPSGPAEVARKILCNYIKYSLR